MAIGILSLILTGAMLYFAVVGIMVTVNKYKATHGLELVRDLLKYLVLIIAVLVTCLGLSGLLGLLLDVNNVDYYGKLEAARWLAFIVIGTPVTAIMARWIRKDFKSDGKAVDSPAWQIYLFAASTSSLLLWFIPLSTALQWFVGEGYRPRALAQAIVALAVWFVHIYLINSHTSVISNIHRFAGMATGVVASAVAAISLVNYGLEKWIGIATGQYEYQNAALLLVTALPVAIYYWNILDSTASDLEIRVYRTFAGKALPLYFIAVSATLALGKVLIWYFGEHIADAPRFFLHSTMQISMVIVLSPLVLYFRHLVSNYKRDNISQLFQYLVSGSALIGAGVSAGWFIAGLFEFNTFRNTSIDGFSGMMVILPLWWFEWRHCQSALHADFTAEHASPIRRVFLYVMIGVPTLSAFGFAVWLSYVLFKVWLVGGYERSTVAAPVGAVISAGLIAIYQYRVYRAERNGVAKRRLTLAHTS